MTGEKHFRRAGFQDRAKTVYVQRISRRTPNGNGDLVHRPPDPGQIIVTKDGPFVVEEVSDVLNLPDRRRYFRARGHLRNSR